MSVTFFDKTGKEVVLAEASEIIAKHLTFYTGTTVSVTVGAIKGVTLVAIALNGSTGFIFDIIYHSSGSILNIVNLGSEIGTYKLSGSTLTVSSIIQYSEGFMITSP